MATILEKDVLYKCDVDEILHPNKVEESARIDKNEDVWTVFRTYIRKGTHYEPRVCSGMAPPLSIGDSLTLVGDLVDTEKYGIQFQFIGLQKQVPTEHAGIVNFFVKNVNGVGPKIAERIVDVLGTDAIEKIKKDPAILETVNGVSKNKADNIIAQLDLLESSMDELKFWAKTGLGNARINIIKSTYNNINKEKGTHHNALKIIQKNPYQLIADVKGIGFRVADNVALNIGFAKNDVRRIAAGVNFTLKEEVETKGNIWMAKDKLRTAVAGKSCLNISVLDVDPVIEDMIKNEDLIQEDERMYIPAFYYMEYVLSDKLKEMMEYKAPGAVSDEDIKRELPRIEMAKGRTLDDGQRAAVELCIKNNVSIITGGPGCGKTTTLDILLSFLEDVQGMEVTMAAPTGRAAKRMTEQTGRLASTVHRLSGSKNVEDFIIQDGKQKVIVVDESSMVDMLLMKMITDLCDASTKLIFVGDIDQLPSIGPGQVLRDMIESGVIPTAKLTKIHRQSADSHIITNAHAVISGKHLEKEIHKDFFVSEQPDEATCLRILTAYVCKSYPKQLGVDPKDIQVLAPLKRGILGVNNLNIVLQNALNPAAPDKNEYSMRMLDQVTVLREGDRVIQNKNNYNIMCYSYAEKSLTKGVFNGEIGVISKIENDNGMLTLKVQFEDKEATYSKDGVHDLSLAYAISIHKSQGSEFKTVIIPLFQYMMPTIYNRNLLYTAITRAKSYCCIIGQRQTTNKMIHNNKVNKRRTTFSERLKAND